MEQMLTLAMQEGILICDFPLVYPLLGIYLCNQNTTPVIGLMIQLPKKDALWQKS
ncbi:MAG: hypothetical protein H6Q69_1321 [Firmicutes bacterium]|nr:hypothetical protein [Bacillota bacterium]